MRVEVSPRSFTVAPGQPAVFSVQVFNTRTVISGHRVRVLGIDPTWVELDQPQLSLLPESLGVTLVTIQLPKDLPAGVRTVGFEVSELTPPAAITVTDVELTIPAQTAMQLTLDPVSSTGGKSSSISVTIANTGNSVIDVALDGTDEEQQIEFGFVPATWNLMPGEHDVATAELKARRPWFGSPKVRPFTIEAGPSQPPVTAVGAWVQRPRLSRGTLALVGLLTAVTVFAAVLTASLSKVVSTSAADRDLALQVASAGASAGSAGTSGITGAVTQLTSGAGIGGVTVVVFDTANTATPLVSTATGPDGGYQFAGLKAGNYDLAYRAAGFSELWYANSLSPTGATTIVLTPGKTQTGVNVRLGGVPASISGQVVGAPAGATILLEVPPAGGTASAVQASGTGSPSSDVPVLVTQQTLDASGNFTLGQVPSPSTYLLVVKKEGYATQVETINLGGGEQRTGVIIALRQGDGSISGLVSSATGPLPGATISATASVTSTPPGSTAPAGQAAAAVVPGAGASATSVSLTQGNIGSFTLNNLPTPGTFTVTVSAPGFATQTLTLSLAAGQHLTGVAVTMATGVGSISGTVTTPAGTPPGGVAVSVTNGVLTLQTMTLSVSPVGTYTLAGLPVPSTYTITYSRPDLAPQTKAVNLGGSAVSGGASGATDQTGIDVSMQSASAVLFGVVTQQDNTALGNITVALTSGTTTYSVVSATSPTLGAYEIDGIAPGTYTVSFTRPGGLPTSQIVTLAAGQRVPLNPVLALAASISGTVFSVVGGKNIPLANAGVTLFLATQFPSTVLASTQTDVNGHYVFQNLDAPQGYVVEFAASPGATGQSTQVVNLGQSQQYVVCGPSAPTAGCPVVVGG